MYESVIDRIEKLERAVCRWRAIAIVLGVLLLSIITSGATFTIIARTQARREMELARQAEAAARAQAEAALRAEQARREAARK